MSTRYLTLSYQIKVSNNEAKMWRYEVLSPSNKIISQSNFIFNFISEATYHAESQLSKFLSKQP